LGQKRKALPSLSFGNRPFPSKKTKFCQESSVKKKKPLSEGKKGKPSGLGGEEKGGVARQKKGKNAKFREKKQRMSE